MINPDNFIFHSDFWYPTDFKEGSKDLDVSLPTTTALDDIEDGDYFSAWLEYPNQPWIYGRSPYDQFNVFAENGKLWFAKAPQFGGARFKGTVHYRIYHRDKNFLFRSTGKCEIIAKRLTGTMNMTPGSNVSVLDVPSGMSGKYLVRGTYLFRGVRGLVDSSAGPISLYTTYDYGANTIKLNATMEQAAVHGEFLQYDLQLIPVKTDHPWVFHSDKFAFCLPRVIETQIRVQGVAPARTKWRIRGESFDIPGTRQAYDYLTRHSINTRWQSRGAGMNGGLNFLGFLEIAHDKITPIVEVDNSSYGQPTAIDSGYLMFRIYEYQNNIS